MEASATRARQELFTISETANILSLSKRTVEDLIAKGLLRSAIAPGTGRVRRVSQEMIEDYVRDFNAQNPPALRQHGR